MKIRSYFKNSFRILMLASVCFFYSPNSFATDSVSNPPETAGKLPGMVQDLLTLMKKIENLKVVQDTLSKIGDSDKADGQAIGGVARSVSGQEGQGDFLNYKQEIPEFLQGMAVSNVQMVKARVTEYFYSLPENGGKITAGERRRFLIDMTHRVISDAAALAVSSINKAIEDNKKEITNLQSTAGKGESMIEIANSLIPVEMEKVKVLRGQNNNLATELKLAATETAMYLHEIGEETEEDDLAEAYKEIEQMDAERDKNVDQTLYEVMQVINQLEQKVTESMLFDDEIEQETQGGEQ